MTDIFMFIMQRDRCLKQKTSNTIAQWQKVETQIRYTLKNNVSKTSYGAYTIAQWDTI